jgi:hypothetical protein
MDNYEFVIENINNTLGFIGVMVYLIAIPLFISKKYISFIEKNNYMKH